MPTIVSATESPQMSYRCPRVVPKPASRFSYTKGTLRIYKRQVFLQHTKTFFQKIPHAESIVNTTLPACCIITQDTYTLSLILRLMELKTLFYILTNHPFYQLLQVLLIVLFPGAADGEDRRDNLDVLHLLQHAAYRFACCG